MTTARSDARRPRRTGQDLPGLRPDSVASAHAAGLRYVDDAAPGDTRRRRGGGFTYLDTDGVRIREPARLAWIRSLAIPPAWTHVWICPNANGHIQATGRDARGRKQYRYHPRWRSVRDETKYERLTAFGEALPRIRSRVDADLASAGLPREKVIACVIQLLELTFIRVGNEEYARLNRSFGLTTLRNRHVVVDGTSIRFAFRGKSGKHHDVGLRDRRLARLLRRCQELPGQELFQYLDAAGARQSIESADVNAYLRDAAGGDFTAKDLRTWAGTVLAFRALSAAPKAESDADAHRTVVEVIRVVAGRLGNTPAVCRASYVHPEIVAAFFEGTLRHRRVLQPQLPADGSVPAGEPAEPAAVDPLDPHDEAAVLKLLATRAREGTRLRASVA
jgi:DNA topoisomerase-1